MMKRKTIFILSSLSFFALASTALAQGFVPLAPIPGLTDPGTATSIINADGFANFFNNLYKYCIGLASALAVIMIIWGGLEISTQDSVSQQSKGREHITQAIYGLILVLSPVLVFSIINPSILNLSLNLPRLNIVTGASIQTQADITPYTISAIEEQSREASGGTVLYAFQVNSNLNLTPQQTVQRLNAEQQNCTNYAGGPGIILPDILSANTHYVCQTCPPNTTLTLYSTCSVMNRACGACAP